MSQLVKHERIETTVAKVLSLACRRFFEQGRVMGRAGFVFEEGVEIVECVSFAVVRFRRRRSGGRRIRWCS